ncbi:MAG: transposase-like protein [Cyanobium sp.]|jgi:transposase-like protein
MSANRIQFQPGMSLPQFMELYGTEEKCEAALEQARWPEGFICPRCGEKEHGLVYGRRHKRYQCRQCRHQATVTAGTVMEATKLPLTTWFLAFYLIGQAKTGISSLALMRQLGVHYRTAWLIHSKIMEAMCEREEAYPLRGKVQIDDAYLGGERNGGKPGRGSENKVPIVAAVSLDNAGHPLHVKLATVQTFSFAAIADWSQASLSRGCEVISDGLACFRAVAEVGCSHQPVIVNGRHPNEMTEFRWINTVLSNLKTSFSGTFHALRFDKYADRYLGAFSYRFNRRFDLAAMTERVLHAVCQITARPERLLRRAEVAA